MKCPGITAVRKSIRSISRRYYYYYLIFFFTHRISFLGEAAISPFLSGRRYVHICQEGAFKCPRSFQNSVSAARSQPPPPLHKPGDLEDVETKQITCPAALLRSLPSKSLASLAHKTVCSSLLSLSRSSPPCFPGEPTPVCTNLLSC